MVMSHVDAFLNRSIVGAKLPQICMLYLAQYCRSVFGYYRSVFYILLESLFLYRSLEYISYV